jgi:hypothetical protein
VTVKDVRAVKWMYLLNGVLCCGNCCTVCMPVHYKSVPDVTVGSQHFSRVSATRETNTRHFSVRRQEEQRQKYVELVVPGHWMFLFLIGKLCLVETHTQKSGLSQAFYLVLDAQSTDHRRPIHRPGRWLWNEIGK